MIKLWSSAADLDLTNQCFTLMCCPFPLKSNTSWYYDIVSPPTHCRTEQLANITAARFVIITCDCSWKWCKRKNQAFWHCNSERTMDMNQLQQKKKKKKDPFLLQSTELIAELPWKCSSISERLRSQSNPSTHTHSNRKVLHRLYEHFYSLDKANTIIGF